ncbi:hypothetical protein [Sinorhizobium americanum]|uniref:hypothetical protein n=1 Tax=Sinorhizobium americanum TaxID=194963 RepID=UPI000691845A|nr:hypothetical protein [Sinorhizobium americanum]
MRRQSHIASIFRSASLATAIALSPVPSSACGYHDDVTRARGLLNWIYPDALHVLGAISAAVAAGQLPNLAVAAPAPDMFGAKYRRTLQSLDGLGNRLAAASRDVRPIFISLVLVEPMLWSRFQLGEGTFRGQMHVAGPQPGDLVLVSGQTVIGEIASGRLEIGKAHQLGLIRLYGPASQQAQFLLAHWQVANGPPAVRAAEHAVRGSQHTARTVAVPTAAISTSDELGRSPGNH